MAIVAGTKKVTFNFQDDDLATASTSVDFPAGTAIASILTFAASYAALIKSVSDCALLGYNVTEEFYDDSYPVAAAGSDVEDKGVVTFRTANNGSKTFSWPGVLESILLNTITPPGTFIDLANVDVAALIAAMTTGLSSIQPSNNRGDDIRTVKEAYKQNRGSQKSREYRG